MHRSMAQCASLGTTQRVSGQLSVAPGQCRSTTLPRTRRLHLQAMQSGWNQQQQQQQQQPQQPMQPMQPMQPQQQQQMGQQQRQPMPLARSPAPYQAAGPVFLELTQVLNKQVITRTSGRCLGSISGAWLDPAAGTLVSFDLDERRQGGSGGLGSLSTPPRAGNIPLSALRQIGDVVLVHDESGLYEQDLDGRLGFVNPVGLDVRTRAGEFLGKVRDLSFSPDSGAIRRITYDEFGLPFLPISFFDCFSVAMQDVISIGRGELLVYDDAKYRERKESAGLFAAIPSLFKSLNGPSRSGGAQLALPAPGGTSDMYRLGGPGSTTGSSSSSSRFLPTDYTYEQWQADLRRWEAETGMTYEQYLRAQGQQQPAAAPRTALPPAGTSTAAGGYGSPSYGGQQQQYGAQQQYAPPQQQRQPGYMQPQQQQQPMGQPGAPAWQQQQQPQQQYAAAPGQQQYAGGTGQQAGAGGFAGPQGPARMAPNAYTAGSAAAGSRFGAAARQQQGFGGTLPQQQQQQQAAAGQPGQQRAGMGQQPQQQQAAGQARPSTQPQQPLRSAATAAGAAQRTQPQQQPVGGPSSSQAAGMSAQWPAGQQQQQQTDKAASGRPVNDWLERDTRPRIADALADGVLPSSDDAPAPPAGLNCQQQPQVAQQQDVAA